MKREASFFGSPAVYSEKKRARRSSVQKPAARAVPEAAAQPEPKCRAPRRKRPVLLHVLCTALAAILCAGAFYVAERLPAPPRDIAERASRSFAGVLTVWVAEGWQPGSGSLMGWLSRQTAQLERAHPGVYVVLREVDAARLGAQMQSARILPDMVMFSPGLLTSPAQLLALEEPEGVRADIARIGLWEGERYAVPVALGAYALMVDEAALPRQTLGLGDQLPSLYKKATRRTPARYGALAGNAPAALLLLGDQLTGARALLPENFLSASFTSAWQDFAARKAATLPATQRQVHRMEQLQSAGKGFDTWLSPMRVNFTDQVALMALVDSGLSHAQDRRALCAEMIARLLAEEAQQALTTPVAFSVREDAALYAHRQPYALLEQSLAAPLTLPPAFGYAWREEAARLLEASFETPVSPKDALRALFGEPYVEPTEESKQETKQETKQGPTEGSEARAE